jgi:small conductance mechanosensitive channel
MGLLSKFTFLVWPAGVIVLSFIIGYLFDKIYSRFVLSNFNDPDENPTTFRFIGHIARAIIYLTGFGMAVNMIPQLKSIATSMLASAGILAVAIGFASQNAFANIVSGIFIVIFKPFKVNDRITVKGDLEGIVEDINLRHTILRNDENKRIIIPNAVLNNEVVVNADIKEAKICRILHFWIKNGSDIQKAKSIIEEAIKNHKYFFDNRTLEQIKLKEPEVKVKVVRLGETSVNICAWIWAEDSEIGANMEYDLLESIGVQLINQGIETGKAEK